MIDLNNHNGVIIKDPDWKNDEEGTKRKEYHKEHNFNCVNRLIDDGYNIDLIKDVNLIIIDEAQDMNSLNYRLITRISARLDIHIILVGDSDQSINGFRGSDESFLENHGDNTYYLRINYRCDQSIIDFAKYMSKNQYNIISGNKDSHGKKPIYYKCDNENTALNDMISKINRGDIKLSDICIIVHTRFEIKMIKKYFKKYKINTSDKTGIQIKTYHGTKSLEYHTVFLYGFKTHFNNNLDKLNLKYVGITRAKKELYLYYIPIQLCKNNKTGQEYPNKKKECGLLIHVPNELYDIVEL